MIGIVLLGIIALVSIVGTVRATATDGYGPRRDIRRSTPSPAPQHR